MEKNNGIKYIDTSLFQEWIINDSYGIGDKENIMVENIRNLIEYNKDTYLEKVDENLNSDFHFLTHNIGDSFNIKLPKFINRAINTSGKYFSKTQKWIGSVFEIYEKYFVAKLEDLTIPGTVEYADFYFEEISPNDRELIKKGAIFYYTIGILVNEANNYKNEEIISFKRTPLEAIDYIEADKRAESYLSVFGI